MSLGHGGRDMELKTWSSRYGACGLGTELEEWSLGFGGLGHGAWDT